MASLLDDPWIEDHSTLSPAQLHALGALTFSWNACEAWIYDTFGEALGVSPAIARIVSHDLGDITILTKTVELARAREFPDDLIEDLLHASKLYDRCRGNRNTFVHAGAAAMPRQARDEDNLTMTRTKGSSRLSPAIPDTLEDLRRVAEDISTLNGFLQRVFFRAAKANQGQPTRPSRERPPLPASIWSPPPKAQSKRTRPPQSSLGKRKSYPD